MSLIMKLKVFVNLQKIANCLLYSFISLWTLYTVKSPNTFSKDAQWAELESLPGRFWPPGLMFDTAFINDIFYFF